MNTQDKLSIIFSDINNDKLTSIAFIWDYTQILFDYKGINIYGKYFFKFDNIIYEEKDVNLGLIREHLIGASLQKICSDDRFINFIFEDIEIMIEIGKSIDRETVEYSNADDHEKHTII